MQRVFVFSCLIASLAAVVAQTPAPAKPGAPTAAPAAAQASIKDLPVRKVVLYKNGIGYFEHAGSVTGNQWVAIDFTSSQLNDVLQSLTVLDEGGGRIAGVNYNSTTPLAEQLKTLALGMTDDPKSTELFQALRGQRVEVTGGPGGTITGRLMSIETRSEKIGSGDDTVDKFYLTLVAASGAVRVVELVPALSVRPLDAGLQGQLDRYLELLSSAHATGLRHLTLSAMGQGERQLRVSYISEVPMWKSTYRIVFPQTAGGREYANAIVQGWAVVDNTVGADWNNVQLSLVAGAPQSFIQPLSQPLYTRRPEIPIATGVETTPQTHEAAENANQSDKVELSANLYTPPVVQVPKRIQSLHGAVGGPLNGRADSNVVSTLISPQAVNEIASQNRNFSALAALGANPVNSGPIAGAGIGVGGGVYRPSDAIGEGDVSTNAFDEFFE